MVAAILWDFNGVLVDDERVHLRAFDQVLRAHGQALDEQTYFRDYVGLDDRSLFSEVFVKRGGGDPERVPALVERKLSAYLALLEAEGAAMFPGAVALLRAAHAAGLPMAIVSGARRVEIETILRGAGLAECVAAICSADEIAHGKPAPDGYQAGHAALAAQHPGLAIGDCLVFEDAPAGIEAALAAGARCWAVSTSYPPERLDRAERVLPNLDGLTLSALTGDLDSSTRP